MSRSVAELSRLLPGPLVRACAGSFTSRATRQGASDFEGGRARLEGRQGTLILAQVSEGDTSERVAVEFSEAHSRSRLRIQCTCAYFLEGFPCRHVYATLRAIEASGAELAVGLDPRLDLLVRNDLLSGEDRFFVATESVSAAGWMERLTALRPALLPFTRETTLELALARGRLTEVQFRLMLDRSQTVGALVFEVWGRVGSESLSRYEALLDPEHFAQPADRAVVAILARGRATETARWAVPESQYDAFLAALSEHGAAWLMAGDTLLSLGLDLGELWSAALLLVGDQDWRLTGTLSRGAEHYPLEALSLTLLEGFALADGTLLRVEPSAAFEWMHHLRREGPLQVPQSELPGLLTELARMPRLPPLTLPPPWSSEPGVVVPELVLATRDRAVRGEIRFGYGSERFSPLDPASAAVDVEAQRLIYRDREGELAALAGLGRAGAEADGAGVMVNLERSERILPALLESGWRIEAEGVRQRRLKSARIHVGSTTDWFDLSMSLQFDDQVVGLPELLSALRSSKRTVKLGDGSVGILPDEWMRKVGLLAELGAAQSHGLRFRSNQAMLLDLILGDRDVDADARFQKARALTLPTEIVAIDEPAGFGGELRVYQKVGVGWLQHLERLGLGGCLADDMGLGKTIEVLAYLLARKREGPVLVVAPRSLIHNWLAEARRFAPSLRTLAYVGAERISLASQIEALDLIITTYGTVRNDYLELQAITFDLVILDEAQAIKNADSQASKACRALNARQRFALTGTPVENHLGELWAIFEYLSPGLLGTRNHFGRLVAREGGIDLLQRALRPLILRRTKAQVLSELPPKTELTLRIPLSGDEAARYAELRDHYRNSLRDRIATEGLDKSRMHVLEALLRLRQAACHPGLLDPSRRGESSSKLEALLDHLEEVAGEGHKVLVFSQFVQLLTIVRDRLDKLGLAYAYLDGATVRRQEEIERFQNDPDTKLFLVSLKAGGFGLNLTAADFVFILDPWWNPAVEAQAIDRAHRIGQTRPVFAYRLIAEGTVEEKILDLHAQKRRLAEAIIAADEAPGPLTAEDLELLLS